MMMCGLLGILRIFGRGSKLIKNTSEYSVDDSIDSGDENNPVTFLIIMKRLLWFLLKKKGMALRFN